MSLRHTTVGLLSRTMTVRALTTEAVDPAVAVYMKEHQKAVENEQPTYKDPATGYTVFTTFGHLKRGYCCGNTCRHCPYEFENVGKKDKIKQIIQEKRLEKQANKKNTEW